MISTEAPPSSETDPNVALEAVVIRSRMSFLTSKVTSTTSPASSTSVTVPFSTPATITGEPDLRPATVLNCVFRLYRSQKNPRLPVSRKMVSTVMPSATIVRTPILSSDQASERVRGIFWILEALSSQLTR